MWQGSLGPINLMTRLCYFHAADRAHQSEAGSGLKMGFNGSHCIRKGMWKPQKHSQTSTGQDIPRTTRTQWDHQRECDGMRQAWWERNDGRWSDGKERRASICEMTHQRIGTLAPSQRSVLRSLRGWREDVGVLTSSRLHVGQAHRPHVLHPLLHF